jgi:hypothetical protein
MTDFRALLQELMDAIDSGIPAEQIKQSPLAVRIDAALSQPEPQGPTDEELDAVWDEEAGYFALYAEAERFGRAVLERWGRQ